MSKASVTEAMELLEHSPDCSYLLTHLVRQNDGKTDVDAKDILKKILGITTPDSKLIANEIGYYSTASHANILKPASSYYSVPSNKKSVCFTESSLKGLLAHLKVFNAKYGVAFSLEFLLSKGANPVLNISEEHFHKTIGAITGGYDKVYNHIPEPLTPFVNIINSKFDATHEREWRIAKDFDFDISDVLFIFCPTNEFSEFSHLQNDGLPILFNLNWLKWV